MPHLVIIEDEEKLRRLLVRSLKDREQWKIDSFPDAEQALQRIQEKAPDVVLTDLRLPGMSGIDFMECLRRKGISCQVVVMTAYASVTTAIEALRQGAVDYLIKPFPSEELLHVLDRLEKEIQLVSENINLRERLATYEGGGGLIGQSEVMTRLCRQIAKVAPAQSTVLIRGESGTGKELIARSIHEQSGRKHLPLVRVNCGAIPDNLLESELFGHVKGAFTGATERRVGRFELAGEGTLFLDEMGDLPLGLQVKLLRVLQEREYEPVGSSETRTTQARILAATNRNLEQAIQAGQFREDLYYRLNVVSLTAPPLRQHLEDLPLLVEHIVAQIAAREGLPCKPASPQFLECLQQWRWPGNVRELENVLESALIMGEGVSLEVEDLPAYIQSPGDRTESSQLPQSPINSSFQQPATLDEMERSLILKALKDAGGNQSEAARKLGITRRTLGYRRAKYGI